MKKIFLLGGSIFLMAATKCGYDAKGVTPAFIYPKENLARVRTVTQSCPVQVSEARDVPLQDLTGWLCVPPEQGAAFRRAFEKYSCGQQNIQTLQAAPQEVETQLFTEELNANIILRDQKAGN